MDDPEGNDDVFCPILWQVNGGEFTQKGKPIFRGDPIRGKCRNPGDCDRCGYMQQALLSLATQGVNSLWICPGCVSEIRNRAADCGVTYKFPGFFAEGYCQRPDCEREGDDKFSIVLQLITVAGPIIP